MRQRGKYIRTSEIREKNRKANLGQISAFKGRHHTPEMIEYLKMKSKQRGKRRPHTLETRRKIREAQMGERSHSWRGGITHNVEGRTILNKNGIKQFQSRNIIEKVVGRLLQPREIVHHINEDKRDDRVENLFLFRNQSAHLRWHHYLRRHCLSGKILTSNCNDSAALA